MTPALFRSRLVRLVIFGLVSVGVAVAAHAQTRFVRFDLVTQDPAGATAFYEAVFGWSATPQSDAWTLLSSAAGHKVGGIFHDEDGDDAIWVPLLLVQDVHASADHFKTLGGKALFGPNEIDDGRLIAVFEDSEGAILGLTDEVGGAPPALGYGDWIWVELWSEAPGDAVKTYRELGGFDVTIDVDGSDGVTHVLRSGGMPRAGIVSKPYPQVEPHWLPYVLVEDLDAVVKAAHEAGGKVAVEPMPGKHGRSTILVDPTGAGIGVFELGKDAMKEAGS